MSLLLRIMMMLRRSDGVGRSEGMVWCNSLLAAR